MASIGHPYVMWSKLFAGSAAADAVLSPEERVFKNTTPYWLRVNSIGVSGVLLGANSEVDMAWGAYNVADDHQWEWKIRFGSTEVTNGWVPVAATTWTPYGNENGAQVVFSKPVYLAPNDRLDVRLRSHVGSSATDRPFLFARCTPVIAPDAIRVPTLYGWRSALIQPDATVSEAVPVGTFYNEFAETLLVERMIGRTSMEPWYVNSYYATAGVLVDLALHDGTKITRGPTPLASVFDLARQSWAMNFSLPPKGYVTADLSGTIDVVTGLTFVDFYTYLGMLGYRTIG